MSKHRKVKIEYESPGCCNPYMYGMGGGTGYGGVGYGGAGIGGTAQAGMGIRWIYALLILIVIVLQFGRKEIPFDNFRTPSGCCGDGEIAVASIGGYDGFRSNQLIDNSVLFIIVVFLLILCAGCWWGGSGAGGGSCGMM